MTTKRWMTIHFNDGSEMKFEFPVQGENIPNIASGIKTILNDNQLMVEVEGILYAFPFAGIKYIRVSPCPPKLPDTAILGAVLRDD